MCIYILYKYYVYMCAYVLKTSVGEGASLST